MRRVREMQLVRYLLDGKFGECEQNPGFPEKALVNLILRRAARNSGSHRGKITSCYTEIFSIEGHIVTLFDIVLEQYPDIAPPTVMVMTSYPGASAETVQIYVYFRQGTDPDMATVNVMNRVSMATGSLPAEVNKIGVTVLNLIPDDITGILAKQNIEAATGSFAAQRIDGRSENIP